MSAVRTRCPHEHSDPRSPTPFPLAHKHSGTISGAIGDILPPGVALTSNLAVIFTLNQYIGIKRRDSTSFSNWIGEQ